MFSLNQYSSSQWSGTHALIKIAGKYAFADINTFG